jgi:hypothetical protein
MELLIFSKNYFNNNFSCYYPKFFEFLILEYENFKTLEWNILVRFNLIIALKVRYIRYIPFDRFNIQYPMFIFQEILCCLNSLIIHKIFLAFIFKCFLLYLLIQIVSFYYFDPIFDGFNT